MEKYASSQAIIKALKGPDDPPSAGCPSKIVIATRAWEASDIHFPNKDEVLAEWILSSFIKSNKDASGSSFKGQVLSTPYWSLLNDILNTPSHHARQSKAWLPALLARVSIPNIMSIFFKRAAQYGLDHTSALLETFIRPMLILWPFAAPRMHLDALTECLGSILEYLTHGVTHLNILAPLCLLVSRTFKQMVGNTSGKKKAFSWFMEQSFIHWVHLVCLRAAAPFHLNRGANLFVSDVYQAGIDVFFNADALKSSADPLEAILTDSRYSTSNLSSSQYQILSMLYKSYIEALRRHRSAVFGSGHIQEQAVQAKLRDTGMKAFRNCHKSLRECGDVLEMWRSLLSLLEVLEEANLVGYELTEDTDILTQIAASAVALLSQRQGDKCMFLNVVENLVSSLDSQAEKSEAALQILCILSRIDFDLLDPLLPEVFTEVISMSPTIFPSTQTLIRAVLDFHTKTRTMPSYLTLLLRTLSDEKIVSRYTDVAQAHRCCMSGALLSIMHLEELSRCTRGFLTPGQTREVVESSLMALESTCAGFSEDEISNSLDSMDIDPTKDNHKQRHDMSGLSVPQEKDNAALRYSLVARAVAVILPSVPFASLSEVVYRSAQTKVVDTWTETLVKVAQYAFTVSCPSDSCWAAQTVPTATLRIRHALLTCSAFRTHDLSNPSIATNERVNTFARSAKSSPELVVELFRAFFDIDFQHTDPEERDSIIDALIFYIKSNLTRRNESDEMDVISEALWDGTACSLNPLELGGHVRGALVLWYLLLDRWLPIFDEIASQDNLRAVSEFFLKIIASGSAKKTQAGQLSLQWIMERALHSALFWELPKLRDALISRMDASTQYADWRSLPELLKQAQGSRTAAGESSSLSSCTWTMEQVQSVLAVFVILLQAPREYLPRNSRSDFIRRAIVADLAIHHFERGVSEDSRKVARKARAVIQTWLISMCDVFDIVDIISDKLHEYTRYLIRSTDEACQTGDIDAITLELFSSIFRQTVRPAIRDEDDRLGGLCSLLGECSSDPGQCFRLSCIQILVAECAGPDKTSPSCLEAVRQLHSEMRAKYSESMSRTLSSMSEITREQVSAIRYWRNCLILQKWLNLPDTTSTFGNQLLQKFIASKHDASSKDWELEGYITEVFLLLLDELGHVPVEDRRQHLELVFSAYILFNGRLQLIDQATCDAALSRSVRSLPTDDFSHVLSLLLEALDKGLKSSNETQTTMHLSALFLEAAPEGTMKVVQEHFEECLHIFIDDPKFATENPGLTLEVLALIAQICSEKPAYLRHLALGPIWLLLAKLLTGSATHTQESHRDILHSMTTIASSLIRLRRDLVTSTLPHLGMVLSSLFRALCSPRAQLGARQLTQVSETLPWWISPNAPLGISEAKAVARLLTSLQAKTIPRTFSKEKHKEKTAESLLSAFSKHAGPVLGAYIGALVDPLVVIDVGMREALAPGLYALCEAMGEHGRDALMASGCDATGRIVLKGLWKDYDKQRYVGKG